MIVLIIELEFNAKFFLNSTLDRITVTNYVTVERKISGCFGSVIQLNVVVTSIERLIAIFHVCYRIILI